MRARSKADAVSGRAPAARRSQRMAWSLAGLVLVAGLALGSAVGLGRMLQGGHFLSDVVFAFWTVYLIGAMLAWLMLERRGRDTGTQAGPAARAGI